MLYVPGCFTRFLNKARGLKVDSVIFDLGDSVLVENKALSRTQVVEAILSGGYGRRELVVRVNDLDSPWGQDDVNAITKIGVDAVLFPNIESRQDVLDALAALDAAGGTTPEVDAALQGVTDARTGLATALQAVDEQVPDTAPPAP
jgi:citrate lyase subunit beta/citryl-CoA lyase